jgi:hypothetical protein
MSWSLGLIFSLWWKRSINLCNALLYLIGLLSNAFFATSSIYTPHFGLLIPNSAFLSVHAFFNVHYSGGSDNRCSTLGYFPLLGSNLISWSSKKQSTITRSNTEAECKSLTNATAKLIWWKSLFSEFGVFLAHRLTLWYDNIGATYLSINPMFHVSNASLRWHQTRATSSIRHILACSSANWRMMPSCLFWR